MVNVVTVLFEGYSIMDHNEKGVMYANCTCTLVRGENNYIVLVDTMTPWDKTKLQEALAKNGVHVKDVKAVVSTHGHSDHVGNNNLFPNIEWCIVGQIATSKDKQIFHDFDKVPFQLTKDISVIATPGHTLSCVSVIVQNTNLGKTVGICGDLFEREDDVTDRSLWLDAGSDNPVLQEQNRLKIANNVDIIIPGHGPYFEVTDEIRDKLKNLMFA